MKDVTKTLGAATYRLSVTNDGLGPALVRSATLIVDGKRVTVRSHEQRVAVAACERSDGIDF